MHSRHTQAVIDHYEQRHAFRGNAFGDQPFANYGYWSRPGLSLEAAAEALTNLVAASAGLAPGDKVLDVGCGYGAGAVTYMRRFQPDSVIGIDVTDLRIRTGQDYVADCGLADRIELQTDDATAMSFADDAFDKLISVECAFHFDTRVDFLNEAARVLRPGGTLALTDMIPAPGVDPAAYQQGERATGSGVCLDMPVNAYDAETYAGHLAEAGFIDIRIESIVAWTRARFAAALAAIAAETEGERGQTIATMAERNRERVERGEDYVLVTARRGN